MRYAHTAEQVRSAEAVLMATLPVGTLMQRAAAGLAVACADFLGRVYGTRILVLAGSGNNGGDALFAGARLAKRGAQLTAILLSDAVHDKALESFRRAGGKVIAGPEPESATGPTLASWRRSRWSDVDLVIDGIVGIGGQAGLREEAARIVDQLKAPVVAVDVPSGVGIDTGEVSGAHVIADLTVTFGTHKIGLLAEPSASAAGVVELVDIGLFPYLSAPAVEVLSSPDVQRLLPWPASSAHKYSRGVLGVAAGSPQYTGAGLLVTSAAVATGFAGMVRYDGASADLVRSAHPEVVIGTGQVQAWVVGSGVGDGQGEMVGRILGEALPTVVDADGLRHLPPRCEAPTVLTPHAGELALLLGAGREQIQARMLEAATAAARRWQCVVLLKGPRTVVAAPDGRVRINTTGVPWLATAGSGDVLAGVIGALLAAGLDCFDAASVGAWLHGAAATLAARGIGSDGSQPFSASSLVLFLPAAIESVWTSASDGSTGCE